MNTLPFHAVQYHKLIICRDVDGENLKPVEDRMLAVGAEVDCACVQRIHSMASSNYRRAWGLADIKLLKPLTVPGDSPITITQSRVGLIDLFFPDGNIILNAL